MSRLVLIDKVHYSDKDLFEEAVKDLGKRLEVDPNHLMMVMYFESQLNPQARNPHGTASGLIQFTALTAKQLGTSIHEIRKMDALQQLKYVYLYLKPFKGKMDSFLEIYLAIFFPKAVGKPLTYRFPLKKRWVEANKVFDVDKNGMIQKWEVNYKLSKWFWDRGIHYGVPVFK